MITDEFLLQVNRPARYTGGEWNASKKDFSLAEIKFALCFPDLYEVGMSNLGIRILYGILNNMPEVCCERIFAPHPDMEKLLRGQNQEIFSLESRKPLKEFDIIGFSLGYELNYTNVLNILELGSLPLKSAQRDHRHPLVIGGGPCVMNPEPMSDFFDLFLIGEAEEAIMEVIKVYAKLKDDFRNNRISKNELLKGLSRIEGVYVPSLYSAAYGLDGKIESFKAKEEGVPLRIKKRFIKDLNSVFFPPEWLVPYIEIVHDRITLELMRGCPHRCNFCQARVQYAPLRFRGAGKIENTACDIYKRTGYEEVSLTGLSISDYPGIEQLVENLIGSFKAKGVSVSLPSVRPKVLVGNLSSLIAKIKKTSLTFAPEAATEALRRTLNKDFDLADFQKTIEQAYEAGYRHVKLYFMIGLPEETEDDIRAIIDFACQVSELKKPLKAQVNISINTLIPKPHTAFERLRMENYAGILAKQALLQNYAKKNKRIKLSLHNPRMSFLEGVISRGDRRLGSVILSSFRKGARFDSWGEHFDFGKWQDSFREESIDPEFYLQERANEEVLPWDFLDLGVK